jgi:hypothetical protein
MSEQRTKCLRALADFLRSSSCGWCFRVPSLLKIGEETVTVPSDEYISCLESPLGMSTETLVEGLTSLKFPSGTTTEWRKEFHLT